MSLAIDASRVLKRMTVLRTQSNNLLVAFVFLFWSNIRLETKNISDSYKNNSDYITCCPLKMIIMSKTHANKSAAVWKRQYEQLLNVMHWNCAFNCAEIDEIIARARTHASTRYAHKWVKRIYLDTTLKRNFYLLNQWFSEIRNSSVETIIS